MKTKLAFDAAIFLRILKDAEHRVATHEDAEVVARSTETVSLCHEAMRINGITREQLHKLARS